jgi:hypothetical protein
VPQLLLLLAVQVVVVPLPTGGALEAITDGWKIKELSVMVRSLTSH